MHTHLFLMYLPEGGQLLWLGLVVIIFCLPFIFYLLTLQNTLKLIAPNNQKMRPGQVWFTLIPIFGPVWHFFVVNNVSMSIENEFRSKNLPIENKPAYTIGLITCILFALRTITFLFGVGSIFVSIVAYICLIIFWIKINGYKNQLIIAQNTSIPTKPEDTGDKYFKTNL
ncbi:MAG TPA: hypothetical protein VHA52_08080 [Candidatus Babeliaceae bacterium]|nr:hypothetical protein [Candidatus Babeliaceae bacterium]